ncbi:hypothetical protein MP228_004795 [Amoeboaphelidium protococcarum]|nr:hypothetical protein MP228_004795 [Amoeboaphelidium protococcarum]
MSGQQFNVVVDDKCADDRIYISTLDMNRQKYAVLQPLLLNEKLVLTAWPDASLASNTVKIGQLSAENLDIMDSASNNTFIRVFKCDDYVFHRVKKVIIVPLQSVRIKKDVLLHLVKNHLLQAQYCMQKQNIAIKYLNDSIKLSVKCQLNLESTHVPSLISKDLSSLQSITSVGVVCQDTIFTVKSHNNNNSAHTQSGSSNTPMIAGMKSQLKLVRDMIELPLTRPDLYAKYNIKPVKGILLYGQAGTGKTLMVRYLARELNLRLTVINGAEVASQYHGESEKKLRDIWQQARDDASSQDLDEDWSDSDDQCADINTRRSSILFIDEIDALFPRRDTSQSETEKRLVATMLTLMDGMEQSFSQIDGSNTNTNLVNKGHMIVIGATNRPNALDPALRRTGRFDKEIEIGVPSSDERLEIFDFYLSKIPHNLSREQIISIADSSHGYVGADIAGLCREASLLAMERVIGSSGGHVRSDSLLKSVADEQCDRLVDNIKSLQLDSAQTDDHLVQYQDFLHAKTLIKPSAMREISLEIPKVHWSDIGGLENVKRRLKESVEWPIQNPQVFKQLGIEPPKGVLLYGPSGCSKTLLAKAIATESGLNFYAIKGSELFSKWVGESEKAVREVFRKAKASSPSIVFFDEIDAVAVKRSGFGSSPSSSNSNGSSVGDRVLIQLLNEMDGVEMLSNVIIIAATNRPDILDPALLRPGRLDRLLYIPPPDKEARLAIIRIRTAKMPLADDVAMDVLAERTNGMSGAEIVALCREAAMDALSQVYHHSQQSESNASDRVQTRSDGPDITVKVSMDNFDQAFRVVRPRITQAMLDQYERFAQSLNNS